MNKTVESFEFKTEVNQLLDLVIHSLYSHKDIFLRELISNASDALDKIRFESLQHKDILGNDTELKIKIVRDDKQKTLTIADNGIGMSKEDLINNLGTIARSGTREFLEKIRQAKGKLELIGQFGVGFYSSFMVADKVTVLTKTADGKAYQWVSQGEKGFELEEAEKPGRGTEVTLHLKKDAEEYLEEYRLREIIRKYSDFVEYPIVMDIEREEKPKDKDGKELAEAKAVKVIKTEVLNSRKAVWARNKDEITREEYVDFYKHVAHDFEEPLEIIHYSAEGTNEFKALLYIPAKAPLDLFLRESVRGINLYIKRVFIMHDCKKLIPEYLRFIRGVVDSSDLPLNVSREILQEDAGLSRIQKNLVKKILSVLKTMKDKEPEKYLRFYREFGSVLKEGLHTDYENKESLMDLLLYETTKTTVGQYRSLADYVKEMSKEQKDIYYLLAENREIGLASPHLEIFRAKNYEVLLMTDPVDEWIVGSMFEYQQKALKPVHKGDLELGDKKEQEETQKKAETQFGGLIGLLKTTLSSKVKDIRFSFRLTDSACCLVADENAVSESMARVFKSMGQEIPVEKRILELNPAHPLIAAMQKVYEQQKDSAELQDYAALLYDQALLAEGARIENPLDFTRKLSKLMLTNLT